MTQLPQYEDALPVGRDGFFAFYVLAYDIDAQSAFASLSIEVRSDGDLVEGTATLLDAQSYGAGEPVETAAILVGWQANSMRPAGEFLRLNITAHNSEASVSSLGWLEVKDVTAELPEPDLTFQDWRQQAIETEPTLYCGTDGGPQWSFGAELRKTSAATIDGPVPSHDVVVAWKYTFEALPGKGQPASEVWPWFVTVPLPSEYADLVFAGDIEFMDEPEEYCVRVTVRDLRGTDSHSSVICDSPERPLPEAWTDSIANCPLDSLPPELRARWCAVRNKDPLDIAACEKALEPTGDGGAANAPDPAKIAGGAAPVDAPANAPIDPPGDAGAAGAEGGAAEEARATSKGCTCGVAVANDRGAWLAFGTAALFALGFARRRARSY